MQYCKTTGLAILRILIGGLFIYHGITKFGADAGMVEFIGGTFHKLGLSFISQSMWTTILGIVEVLAGSLLALGLFTRSAAIAVIVVMLGAMNAKWWTWPNIELDIIYLGCALALLFTGPGRCSCDFTCCKGGECCGWSCDTKISNDPYKGKEVVEA